MNIEQIALEVDTELCLEGIDIEANEFPAEFLRRCLSKLADQVVEPVACIDKRNWDWHVENRDKTSIGIWRTSDYKRVLNTPEAVPMFYTPKPN